MRDDFTIELQLADRSGAPVARERVLVDVIVFLHAKVRYKFNVGMTSALGKLTVNFDQLEKVRLENQKMFLMDYNTPLVDCDPKVEFSVPGEKELQERVVAIKTWFPSDVTSVEKISGNGNSDVVCEGVSVDVDLNPEAKILIKCDVA